MLTTHEIDQYLLHTPSEHADIIRELRSLIARHAPGVSEVIKPNWISYYYAEKGGTCSAGVCIIHKDNKCVRLAFIHGAFLPDPKHLLAGNVKFKKHVILTSFDAAPWEELEALIAASTRFDPRTESFSRKS